MQANWQRYLAEMRRFLPYLAVGPLLGALAHVAAGWSQGRTTVLPPDTAWAAVIGLVVALGVYASFAAFYAALTAARLRGLGLREPHAAVHVAIAALGSGFGLLLAGHLDALVHGPANADTRDRLGANLVYSGLLTAAFALLHAWRRSAGDALRLRAALAEARADALERHLRPHFLFNALNGLVELIDSGHPRASETAQALADLYRLMLQHARGPSVALSDEVALVQRYLELEQVRLGPRLRVSIDVAADCRSAQLPGLTLLTLAENAIKHGIAPARAGGELRLLARRAPGVEGVPEVVVQVWNGGCPPAPAPGTAAAGLGLAHVRTRLDLVCGPRHGFALERPPGAALTLASFRLRADGAAAAQGPRP